MKSGMMPLWIILIRQPHIIPYLDINHTTKGRVSASYPVYMKVYTLITNSVVSFFEDDKYIEMFAKVTSYLPSNLTKNYTIPRSFQPSCFQSGQHNYLSLKLQCRNYGKTYFIEHLHHMGN